MKKNYSRIKKKLIIVGAGAAGLFAAIEAKKNGLDVLVLERMDRPGKKILATGNGKCNLTNSFYDKNTYRGENSEFAYHIIHKFDYKNVLSFFESLGLFVVENNGYYYPKSGQASTVLEVLLLQCKHQNIPILCENEVIKIKKKSNQFEVFTKDQCHLGDYVLLCGGGKSNEKLGSNGSAIELAKELGHNIIPLAPALCALHAKGNFFKETSGVRVKAKFRLKIDGTYTEWNQGELQLTDYGISGVMVFCLSRYAVYGLMEKKGVYAHIDFIPDLNYDECKEKLLYLKRIVPYKTIPQALEGIFNQKLALAITKVCKIKTDLLIKDMTMEQCNKLCGSMKNFQTEIINYADFSKSQVTAGGVSTSQIHPDTMESKLIKGLYFAGEMVDVDGTCGGYNLQWAFSSGMIAAKSISKEAQI